MEILQRNDYFQLVMTLGFWGDIALVIVITLFAWLFINKLISFIHKRIETWSTPGVNKPYIHFIFFEVIDKTKKTLIVFAAFLFSLQFVTLPGTLRDLVAHAWFLVLACQIAVWLDQGIQSWLKRLLFSPGTYRNPVTLVILGLMLRALIWTVMLLSILANTGVNITALVASLGVGGIAIALAVQTVLSDVFASLSIGFDKPFEIGDFIVFNNISGTIEHIGLKTTRIRSLSGEQIVCANAILLQQIIHNYKRMQTRRIVFTFGVACSTPPEKLRKIGSTIKDIVERSGETTFDRAHFSTFEQDRLTFEVVHIMKSADYNKYMDVQQDINIGVIEALNQLQVTLAVPCRVILSTDPAPTG